MANPDIPLCDLASLNWVSHRVPSSPVVKKVYIYSDVSHTHTLRQEGGEIKVRTDEMKMKMREMKVR